MLVMPGSVIAGSVLHIDCFHAAFSMQAAVPEHNSEGTCQQPMVTDSQSEPGATAPALPATRGNEHKHGTLTVRGMQQAQVLLSSILKLTAYCIRRSPLLLSSSSFMKALPSVCNLAGRGGIQVRPFELCQIRSPSSYISCAREEMLLHCATFNLS